MAVPGMLRFDVLNYTETYEMLLRMNKWFAIRAINMLTTPFIHHCSRLYRLPRKLNVWNKIIFEAECGAGNENSSPPTPRKYRGIGLIELIVSEKTPIYYKLILSVKFLITHYTCWIWRRPTNDIRKKIKIWPLKILVKRISKNAPLALGNALWDLILCKAYT